MKIAVAGFQHETNRFSPVQTSCQDFVQEDGWPGLTQGRKLWDVFLEANIPLGGFLQYAKQHFDAVPILWASAEPAGLVHDDAFDQITDMILEGLQAAMPLDGIYLDLHGAMVCQSYEDGEGEFLRRLRNRLGNEIPIAVSLDLHANVTPESVALADVMTIYRTYPHIDMADTGYRAGALLRQIIATGQKPHCAFRQLPFLIPLPDQCTNLEPARTLYEKLPLEHDLETGSADIALGFPASDIAQMGPAIVAYDYSKKNARQRADQLEQALLDAESSFNMPIYRTKEAVRLALQRGPQKRPIILADAQDVSGAGSMSDSTELLEELARVGIRNCAVGAIYDKEVVKTAHSLGVGAEFSCELGDNFSGPEQAGFQGRFRVVALSDGMFEYHGEMMSGITAKIGPTAALELVHDTAEIQIVVTSERIQLLDQAIMSHIGIKPEEKSYLAIKSVVHFRADFDSIADEIIIVEARGFSPCRFREGLFPHLRKGVRLL